MKNALPTPTLRPEHGIRQKIKRQKVKRQNSKGRKSNGRKIKRQKKQEAENSVGRKSKCRNYNCNYFILWKHLKHAENGTCSFYMVICGGQVVLKEYGHVPHCWVEHGWTMDDVVGTSSSWACSGPIDMCCRNTEPVAALRQAKWIE